MSSGQSSIDFGRIVNGVIRVAKLDRTFYREIENDPSYTMDAWVVVIVVSLIGALGAFIGGIIGGSILRALGTLVWTAVWGVVGFYIWVFLTHWIGTSFFKGQGTTQQLQRCLGFAYGPQILGVLAFIPCLGWIAALAGWILSIVAGYFAVQEALDQDSTNALLTIIISAVIVFVVGAVIAGILAAIGLAGAAVGGAFR
jgi:hypothetical protein